MSRFAGYPFFVNNAPYCVWGKNVLEINKRFIENYEVDYFSFIADLNRPLLVGEFKHKAGLNLRTAYFHGLEALFSLLFSGFQAPYCVPAWLTRFWPNDLREMIKKVGYPGQKIPMRIVPYPETWDAVSEAVHQNLKIGDPILEKDVKRKFAMLWNNLASIYCDLNSGSEYNAIKHGFGVHSGGFGVTINIEPNSISEKIKSKEINFGESEFGTSFYLKHKLAADKISFCVREQMVNWDAPALICCLQLISMSLRNIRAFLLNTNGADIQDFAYPSDLKKFDAWRKTPGCQAMSIGLENPEELIPKLSKKDIRASYSKEVPWPVVGKKCGGDFYNGGEG